MKMEVDRARTLLGLSRVARLATASTAGEPHLVPVTFVLDGDALYFVVDHKPKSTTVLRRLQNIWENSRVSVLVDHYADELLVAKYPQYREHPPQGAVVAISVDRLTGWSYAS